MGRKRKAVVKGSAIADEVKTSKSYLRTTSPDEKSRLNAESSNAVEATNVEKNMQPNSNGLLAKEETSMVTNVVVRRSGRIRSPVYSSRRQWRKTVVEHVILDENEKEEAPNSEKVNNTLPVVNEKNLEVETQVEQVSPQPDVDERSLEEKVNYLVRTVDEFKPKVIGRPSEASSSDFRYKSLYFQSQKKNEALMEENYELVRKLEFAHGQIAAYAKMMEAMGALKEVIVVSGLGKSTEANVSLPPQMVKNCMPSPSATVPDADDDHPKQKKKKARN